MITNRQLAWKKLVVAIREAEGLPESEQAKGVLSPEIRRVAITAREFQSIVQHDLETKYDGHPDYGWEDEQFLSRLASDIEGFLEGIRPLQQFGVDMGYDMNAPDVGYYTERPYDRLV